MVEEEESVRGYCYTPSLAKRLEKAIRERLHKPKPVCYSIYHFCPVVARQCLSSSALMFCRYLFVGELSKSVYGFYF